MDKHVFAVDTLEAANWLHTRAARAQAVARTISIDVQRKETEGTMVTVTAATGRWADEATTIFALEYLVTGLFDERFPVKLTMRQPFNVKIVFVVVLFNQTWTFF
jgi:hypothetical protein